MECEWLDFNGKLVERPLQLCAKRICYHVLIKRIPAVQHAD